MTSTVTNDSTQLAATRRSIATAIERGCTWLLNRIGDDGHPGAAHCHYYRVPWSLAITGNRTAAASVMSWVERHSLTDGGDLRPDGPRTGFDQLWSSYPLANLATGAWHLERYDTADRIATRLADFQDPDYGGALAAHPDVRTDRRQDLFPTAQLGMTGLTTGHRELADRAVTWFKRLWELQPELPDRLYSATNGDELLRGGADERSTWQVVTDFGAPRQAFYNPGIAAAFLGRYAQVNGDAEVLDLAARYLSLTVTGGDQQFDSTETVQVCKFAWGAAVLFEATGDPTYRDHAVRMADWFIECQNPDGSWNNSPFLLERSTDHDSVRVEITAEFVQHLVTIATAIGYTPQGTPSTGTNPGATALTTTPI